MSAHHFFLPSVDAGTLTIDGDDARHAIRVLRIAPGETITISDGAGRIATATVTAADRILHAEVTDRRDVPAPRPALTIYQGLPKHGKLDAVVQTLTQVGVAAIVPVRTERSVAKWDAAKAASNIARLRTIAREAAMQSRRAYLPTVGDLITAADVPAGTIVLHEAAAERLRALLPPGPPLAPSADSTARPPGDSSARPPADSTARPPTDAPTDRPGVPPAVPPVGVPDAIGLAVGPEGGFSDAEIEAFAARGCPAATLGEVVLRTEVAPLVAASVVLARYELLG